MTDRAYLVPFMRLAAQRLAGRAVDVRPDRPPHPYADRQGVAYKSGETGVVYVDPGLPDDLFLWVFCHEVAHVKHHWRTMGDFPDPTVKLPPPPQVAPRAAWHAAAREETEADRTADLWTTYVQDKYPNLMGQLLSLALDDPPTT